MKKYLLATLVFPLLLTGCKDKIYDVSYYDANIDKATDVAKKCKAGEITDDNCKNAAEALYKVKRKDFFRKSIGVQ